MWFGKLIAKIFRSADGAAGTYDEEVGWNITAAAPRRGDFSRPVLPRMARRPVRKASRAKFRRDGHLPCRTGPLTVLHGRDVLVLCDVDNLSLGVQKLGYKVSYGKLAELFRRSCRNCWLHAFFPGASGDHRRSSYFEARGWTSHMNEVEIVQTRRGPQQLSNSDNHILLWAGWLAARCRANLLVVASGDGSLGCDIARFFVTAQPNCAVATLSLVGSTSCRLDARRNPYVVANLELGQDVLRRVSPPRPVPHRY